MDIIGSKIIRPHLCHKSFTKKSSILIFCGHVANTTVTVPWISNKIALFSCFRMCRCFYLVGRTHPCPLIAQALRIINGPGPWLSTLGQNFGKPIKGCPSLFLNFFEPLSSFIPCGP